MQRPEALIRRLQGRPAPQQAPGGDGAGRQAVDADPCAAWSIAMRRARWISACLRRAVGHRPARRDMAELRRHQRRSSRPFRDSGTANLVIEESTGQRDVDFLLPVRGRKVHHRAVMPRAQRRCAHSRRAAETRGRRPTAARAESIVGHVASTPSVAGPSCFAVAWRRRDQGPRITWPLRPRARDDRHADVAGRAGDQHHLSFEPHAPAVRSSIRAPEASGPRYERPLGGDEAPRPALDRTSPSSQRSRRARSSYDGPSR